MNFSIGSSVCYISVSQIRKRGVAVVELYIPDDKEFYKRLEAKKDEIENAAGMKLDWQDLGEKKARRICVEEPSDFEDKSAWINQFDWIMDKMLRMKNAFKAHI